MVEFGQEVVNFSFEVRQSVVQEFGRDPVLIAMNQGLHGINLLGSYRFHIWERYLSL